LSNIKIDSEEVLTKYRNKDVIEKSFNNLKNRLNLRRTGVHSFQNLEGQVFIQYIGLCFILYVHKHMKKHGLYNNYTIETLFDELDVISRFDYVNGSYNYNKITKKQIELYKYMGVEPII
jgi:transposase